MRRTKQDALVVVWDVGVVSRVKSEPEATTFLAESFECLRKMISNKILVQPNALMGIVTIGSDNTKHELNQEDFPNISVDFELEKTNFDMLSFAEKATSTDNQGDWLGGLVVALNVVKNRAADLKRKSIVLLSPLGVRVKEDDLQRVLKYFKKHEVELTIIGTADPTEGGDSTESDEDVIAEDGFISLRAALTQFHKTINAQVCSIADAVHELVANYTSKQVTPRPWKVDLEIGTRIKLRVCGVNEIAPEERPKFRTVTERDMDKVVVKEYTHFEKGTKRQLEEAEEIIQGFKFGTSIIPFSAENQEDMSYKSGPKSLKLYSFVDKSKISPAMYVGKGQQTFYPEPTDRVSCKAFSAFVQAMIALDQVALVRKVSMNNGRLIFGAMHPEVREPGGERLVLVELPFAEDARNYRFKPEQVEVTDREMEACLELINSMNLMTAMPGGKEAFKARDVPEPTLVHQQEAIIFRALHPDDPLPPPSDNTKAILEPPASIKLVLEKMGPKLNAAFPSLASQRTKTARPGTTKKTDNAESTDAAIPPEVVTQPLVTPTQQPHQVVSVGEETPAADIQMLIHQGMALQEVFNQAKKVVTQMGLRANTHEEATAPLEAVKAMRVACRNQNEPIIFNEWIVELRNELWENGCPLLWQGIQLESLGLLTHSEAPLSSVSDEEARDFLGEGADDSDSNW